MATGSTGRRAKLGEVWARVPPSVRKTIVVTIGGTLVVLGIALVVLPGPFTLPLLLAGFAVLGTEFAWAARTLDRVRDGMEKGAQVAKDVGGKAVDTTRQVGGAAVGGAKDVGGKAVGGARRMFRRRPGEDDG